MPEFLMNTAAMELWDGTLDLLTEALLKAGLYDDSGTYLPDRDDDVADAAEADDFVDGELNAGGGGTGYVAGYGGSGRKALSSKTITVDKGNDRSEFDAADLTWTALDAGTLGGLALLVEDHLGAAGNDTETRMVDNHDTNIAGTASNGGDVTVQIAGLIRLNT